jgi:TPR repeat protein
VIMRNFFAALFLSFASLTALAGNLETGLDHYQQGRHAEALASFRLAAAEDNVKAFFLLGAMHENGEGTKQDYSEALKWYRKAAERGDTSAQANIGTLFEKGQGVPKSAAAAADWYRKAAEAGNLSAQVNLGVLYFNGHGVERDPVEAYKWLYLADMGGLPVAREKREFVEAHLKPEQLAEAKQRSAAWIEAWTKRAAGSRAN